MYDLEYIDEVQSHILGVITGLMVSYKLNPRHVEERYEYILSLPTETHYQPYEAASGEELHSSEDESSSSESSGSSISLEIDENPTKVLWGDMEDSDTDNVEKINVTTRREFCDAMNKGIKICPRYSSCYNPKCKHFHISNEYICPHVTRGSYCDNNGCELIVIRPCRKGKRCNDPECSFKHK